MIGVFVLQVGMAQRSWAAYDARLGAFLKAFDMIEEGSNVALAADPALSYVPVSVRHVASLLVIRRHAFVPNIFAAAGQQPIVLTDKYQRIVDSVPPNRLYARLAAICDGGNGDELDEIARGSLAPFKYLLVIHEPESDPDLTRMGLQRIDHATDFDLYRLR